MGRNAQYRRGLKLATKAEQPVTLHGGRRGGKTTQAMRRLKVKMLEVDTLSQFEQIISAGHPDNRETLRRIMTPMLRKDLPCCGQGQLAEKLGKLIVLEQHSAYCPVRNAPRLVLS